jgi:hypothetical protein
VTIEKGSPYGTPGPAPDDLEVAGSDADAGRVVASARRDGRPLPPVGLTGGDLWRTLGGVVTAPEQLRATASVTYPVDLGEALVDGRLHFFVAHLVAHTPTWSYAFVAMNAQWVGRWNAGPRAHPGDGLLDTYEARLPLGERVKVRSRLHHGAHLPHPGIRERRAPAVQVTLPRRTRVMVDGQAVGEGRNLSVRVQPDAVRVVVASPDAVTHRREGEP